MELAVQKYLRANSLTALAEAHKINAIEHPTLPLVLFKYDAIETRKADLQYHEITRECRSLVLEKNSWNYVTRGFRRFFNLNEYKGETFNWNHYWVQEKLDGSLCILYYYGGSWHVRTSGSFATGNICAGVPHTWSSLFFSILSPNKSGDFTAHLNMGHSYVFELTSPYNKVVKQHTTSSLTLLSIFDEKGQECGPTWCDCKAEKLCVARPKLYNFVNIDEGIAWLSTQPADFEGFVLVDKDYNRVKIKSAHYLRLHRLKDNSNIFLARNLVPLIIGKPEEKDEILTYFAEIKERWETLETEINRIFTLCDEFHSTFFGTNISQKEFAWTIRNQPSCIKSILFTCRKNDTLPSTVKLQFEDLLVKYFETASAHCVD